MPHVAKIKKVVTIKVESPRGEEQVHEFNTNAKTISQLLTLAKFKAEDMHPDNRVPNWNRIVIVIHKDLSDSESLEEWLASCPANEFRRKEIA